MRRSRPLVALSVLVALTTARRVDAGDPLTPTAAWIAESDQAGADFGFSSASAGDVNGDGFDDVIVGAFTFGNGQNQEGKAFVYLGSASGLSPVAAWTAEGNQVNAVFGKSVARAGDVNGDGFDDVIVGAAWFDNGQTDEGRAFVYHGSATGLGATPAWIKEINQGAAEFGSAVACAGDVNGDGFDDVIIGAPVASNGQFQEGRAFVYLGSASGLASLPIWSAESDEAFAGFGATVASAGDVNGDGFDDIVVGAPDATNGEASEGRASVYFGSASGPSTAPDWTFESDQAGAAFALSVAGAGDVNGDGYADVAIGAPYFDAGETNEGRSFVFHGSSAGLSATPAWTAESDQAFASFGTSIASAGDVDGDGFSDLVVGAWQYDAGQLNEGRVFAFLGSSTGLDSTPAWTGESDQANAAFGFCVAPAGDVNGDGYADVIVGSHWFDSGQTDEGRAFVHHGRCDALASALPYGVGKPGTNGVPMLSSLTPPALGTTSDLTVTGGLPAANTVVLFVGLTPAAISFDSGTLLVEPALVLALPALGGAGELSLPVAIPADATLCGLSVAFQVAFVDPLAIGTYHTAATNGLLWTLGG